MKHFENPSRQLTSTRVKVSRSKETVKKCERLLSSQMNMRSVATVSMLFRFASLCYSDDYGQPSPQNLGFIVV